MFLPLTWYLVFSGDVKAMGWFAVHPPMQSLAITAFLLGEVHPISYPHRLRHYQWTQTELRYCLGITPLQPSPPSTIVRQTRFKTHQNAMLGLALPALAVGTAAMWWNKHLHGAQHFTTWHSWFGLATVSWVVSVETHFSEEWDWDAGADRVWDTVLRLCKRLLDRHRFGLVGKHSEALRMLRRYTNITGGFA